MPGRGPRNSMLGNAPAADLNSPQRKGFFFKSKTFKSNNQPKPQDSSSSSSVRVSISRLQNMLCAGVSAWVLHAPAHASEPGQLWNEGSRPCQGLRNKNKSFWTDGEDMAMEVGKDQDPEDRPRPQARPRGANRPALLPGWGLWIFHWQRETLQATEDLETGGRRPIMASEVRCTEQTQEVSRSPGRVGLSAAAAK